MLENGSQARDKENKGCFHVVITSEATQIKHTLIIVYYTVDVSDSEPSVV